MRVIAEHVHWAFYLLSPYALIKSFKLPVFWRHIDKAIAQEPVPYDCIPALLPYSDIRAQPQTKDADCTSRSMLHCQIYYVTWWRLRQ